MASVICGFAVVGPSLETSCVAIYLAICELYLFLGPSENMRQAMYKLVPVEQSPHYAEHLALSTPKSFRNNPRNSIPGSCSSYYSNR